MDGVSYHDDKADAWSSGYEEGAFNRRFDFLTSHLGALVRPGGRWLDAGCGSGVLSRELNRLGAKVEGIDASHRMVEAATRESMDSAGELNYRVVDSIEYLDFPDASFDGILCSSVVEYLAHPERAFAEFSRVLAPGGCLVMTVPNRLSLVRNTQKIARAVYSVLGKDCFNYLNVSRNEYTKSALRQILGDAELMTENLDMFDPIIPSQLGVSVFGSLILVTARRLSAPNNTSVTEVSQTP